MAIKPVPGYRLQEIGAWAVPKAKPKLPQAYVPGGFGQGPYGQQQIDDYLGRSTQTLPGVGGALPGLGGGGAAGGGGGGGRTSSIGAINPSYNLELTSDPLYGDVMGSYNSALQGSRTSLRDQIRRAVIQSGFDIRSQIPESLGEYGGDIDQATAEAALANPLSGRAQLQGSVDTGMNNLAYALAARGTLRSGAEAAGAGALNQGYQQQSNAQMNDLLDAIGGGVRGYQDIYNTQTSNRNQALQQIAARLAAMRGPTYGGGGLTDEGAAIQGLPPGQLGVPSVNEVVAGSPQTGTALAAWQAEMARQDTARRAAAARAAAARIPGGAGGALARIA